MSRSIRAEIKRDYRAYASNLIETDKEIHKAEAANDTKKLEELHKRRADYAHQLVRLADLLEDTA